MKNLFTGFLLILVVASCTEQNIALIKKNPKGLFDPTSVCFVQTVSAPTNGRYLFVAGQVGSESDEESSFKDFRTQTQTVFKNLRIALEANEASPKNVVKQTVLIVDYDYDKLEILKEEAQKFYGDSFAASTLIPVPRLAIDGMLIEIDVTAYLKN